MELTILEYIIILFMGIIAGSLNVLAGGGSMLTVPMMVFFGVAGNVANATNRIAILSQNIVATLVNIKSGYRNFKLAFSLGICTVPGAYYGALVGSNIDPQQFNYILAVIMLLSLILMHAQPKSFVKATTSKKTLILGHLCMPIIGFYGGFIQIGIGFILMPVLYRVMRLPLTEVNVCKVFLVLFYTVVAIFVFNTQLDIAWKVGLFLAIGNAIGGYIGAKLNIMKGNSIIKYVFNIVVIIFIIQLIFK